MKLELKHIVGYLPYGLKLYTEGYSDTKIITINGYDTYEDLGIINISSSEKNGGKNLSEVKPILRPLSDLTKEIEVNGEKFVPMDKLAEIEEVVCLIYALEFFETSSDYLPFWIIEKLYEWHFDVHGLLPKGLAIDKNTLEP